MIELRQSEREAACQARLRVDFLVKSKQERGRYGNPAEIRDTMRDALFIDAIRPAIATDVLGSSALYGYQMREAYERRCRELFG